MDRHGWASTDRAQSAARECEIELGNRPAYPQNPRRRRRKGDTPTIAPFLMLAIDPSATMLVLLVSPTGAEQREGIRLRVAGDARSTSHCDKVSSTMVPGFIFGLVPGAGTPSGSAATVKMRGPVASSARVRAVGFVLAVCSTL